MAYSIIIMQKDRPDKQSRMLTVPRVVYWLMVIWFFFAPMFTFYVTYSYIGPNFLVKEAGELSRNLKNVSQALDDLRVENKNLIAENTRMKEESAFDRERRTHAETQVEISENARITSSARQKELEDKVYELEQSLSFYEEFVKPASTQNILQCFNIKVTPGKDRLKYGVNFLRNDQKKKDRIKTTVRFRVMNGENVLTLEEAEAQEVRAVRKINLVKDIRITGDINMDIPDDGLRILDIKAYDDNNEVIAHCWKAF